MDERKRQGDRGEEAVAAYLTAHRCRVVGRQFRCRWGEIDLIARTPEGILCFVEVKTRTKDGGGISGQGGAGLPLPVRRGRGVPRPGGVEGPPDPLYARRILSIVTVREMQGPQRTGSGKKHPPLPCGKCRIRSALRAI